MMEFIEIFAKSGLEFCPADLDKADVSAAHSVEDEISVTLKLSMLDGDASLLFQTLEQH